jgi:hypothetical protein
MVALVSPTLQGEAGNMFATLTDLELRKLHIYINSAIKRLDDNSKA